MVVSVFAQNVKKEIQIIAHITCLKYDSCQKIQGFVVYCENSKVIHFPLRDFFYFQNIFPCRRKLLKDFNDVEDRGMLRTRQVICYEYNCSENW